MDGLYAVGIAGSIRRGSYNRLLLRNMLAALPSWVEREELSIDQVPPFNQDLEDSPPSPVVYIKERIRRADLLVIATPEYNHSIPGVLKNAIDWISRPPSDNPLSWKAVAIASASTGMVGGARAQEDLRRALASLGAFVVPRPEVILVQADRKFTQSGELTDQAASGFIKALMENAVRLAVALRGVRQAQVPQLNR